MTLLLCILIDF